MGGAVGKEDAATEISRKTAIAFVPAWIIVMTRLIRELLIPVIREAGDAADTRQRGVTACIARLTFNLQHMKLIDRTRQ